MINAGDKMVQVYGIPVNPDSLLLILSLQVAYFLPKRFLINPVFFKYWPLHIAINKGFIKVPYDSDNILVHKSLQIMY